ncbi:hypothetical protein GCM10010193_70460 [Kitasatospora atroaurantiaca]|uniref:SPP1 Gp6-like portal protein n=1 Tax=Kitasatospora atroaurantiaca TaxID=285545 RepID=A0A561END3_9ACTN|nr:phage portal protein [Kitasatospora atroaurantiaca]TWE17131.1 SPP1 Gp6-like portal protein [Kitasatospora atroaurantiaca]
MTASTDLWAGITELNYTRPEYDTAHAYYTGRVSEVFSSARVRRALERTHMGHHLNYCKIPVNAVTDRLELAAVTSTDPLAAKVLDALWEFNSLDLEAPNVHRRAGELGDAYIIAVPIEDESGKVTGVEMHYNSPMTVRVFYSEENPREKAFAVKRWCERSSLGEVVRAEVYYDDRTQRWTTGPGSSGHNEADWMHWLADPVAPAEGQEPPPADDASWEIPNKSGEIPVFHFRSDQPYGIPEHEGAYGCQDAINKLIITHLSTVDYQAFPQRYGLTEAMTTDTGDLDASDFDDDDFPADPASGPTDSGDDSDLKSGPGEMWLLRGYKEVGQFQAANPGVFFDPAAFYTRAMATLTDTPLRRFDTTGGGTHNPSGESLRRDEAPFVKKIRNRQLSYGATWKDLFGYCLRLFGITAPVDVRWAAAASVDDEAGWTTAGLKSKLGVPQRQLLLEAGYTEEQVTAWLETPTDDAAELSRHLMDISVFSEIAQRIGTAISLGALDAAQAQDLLNPLMVALLGQPETAAAA